MQLHFTAWVSKEAPFCQARGGQTVALTFTAIYSDDTKFLSIEGINVYRKVQYQYTEGITVHLGRNELVMLCSLEVYSRFTPASYPNAPWLFLVKICPILICFPDFCLASGKCGSCFPQSCLLRNETAGLAWFRLSKKQQYLLTKILLHILNQNKIDYFVYLKVSL